MSMFSGPQAEDLRLQALPLPGSGRKSRGGAGLLHSKTAGEYNGCGGYRVAIVLKHLYDYLFVSKDILPWVPIFIIISISLGMVWSVVEYYLTERFKPLAYYLVLKNRFFVDSETKEIKAREYVREETPSCIYLLRQGRIFFFLKSGWAIPEYGNLMSYVPFYRGILERKQDKWQVTCVHPTGLYLSYIMLLMPMFFFIIRLLLLHRTPQIAFVAMYFIFLLLLSFAWRCGIKRTTNAAKEILEGKGI
jgi:hypothetical protein